MVRSQGVEIGNMHLVIIGVERGGCRCGNVWKHKVGTSHNPYMRGERSGVAW